MVAVTSTVPAEAAGEVAVHEVVEVQLTEVPAPVPKATVVAEPMTKPVPVMVTTVPPPGGPATGLSPVTVGTAS